MRLVFDCRKSGGRSGLSPTGPTNSMQEREKPLETTLPLSDWNHQNVVERKVLERATRSAKAAIELRPAKSPVTVRRHRDLLSRIVVEGIVSRLLPTQRNAATLEQVAPDDASDDDVAELASIVLQQRFDIASPQIHRISARQPGTEAIYLKLLAPVARRLGGMWDDDLCDFVQATVGLLRLQQLMTTLGAPLLQGNGQSRRVPRLLLVPAPGNQHSFGVAMVASLFQQAGWTGWSGTPSSVAELLGRVRNEWFTVVGFSVSDEKQLDALGGAIRAIRRLSRNRDVGVMVGGPVFIARPELATMVGADATAVDGRHAVLQAQNLLASMSKCN